VKNIFKNEFIDRVLSVIIFVPLVIMPLIYSKYVSVIIYLVFLSIILIEINYIRQLLKNFYLCNIYFIIVIVSFFTFLLLLISEKFSLISMLSIIITIWLFDTFSYLGGKIIGGKKLMPKVSSGKTISGLISGILLTLFCFLTIPILFNISTELSFISALFIIILSFVGDTIVSLLKRYASIKDSGSIMPGHGGLLDRFDSFIIVFFIIGLIN
tara:strand:+ start:569 stop:1207 length:639 start_codon:yes stop_codon:yes gene_type:complete